MHFETLTEKGKQIFSALDSFKEFYLAGGTALALYIGHRQSFDFDLFSDKEIPASLLSRVKKIFADTPVSPAVNNKEELTVFVGEVKITFLYYPFAPVLPLVQTKHISLLSVSDIAATKAYTIGRRGSYKDYIDVYFILKEHHTTLPEVVELAQKKYAQNFNARLFLEQLIYLDDITDTHILLLKEPVEKNDVRVFFEQEIKKIQL